jgi:hypothetical protein
VIHSPADIVRWLLVELGEGSAPLTPVSRASLWPVYATNEPSSPDECITVYDTVGRGDGRLMISGREINHYGVQVRVRSITHRTGWQKAESIRVSLSERTLEEAVSVPDVEGVNGGLPTPYIVHCLAQIGAVLPIGTETTSKRSIFTVNALVTIRL